MLYSICRYIENLNNTIDYSVYHKVQVYLLEPGSLIKVKNFEQKSKSIFKPAIRKYGENRKNFNCIYDTVSIMIKLSEKWFRVVKTKKLIKLILR